MHKSASIILAAAVALATAAATTGVPAPAHAGSGVSGLGPGWTLVRTSSCLQLLQNGTTYIYVYSETGGLLWTNEKAIVVSMEDVCKYYAFFYAYSPDATLQAIQYYPNLEANL